MLVYRAFLKSDLGTSTSYINDLVKGLEVFLDDPEYLFNIKVILNELITNAIDHGNQNDPEKLVDIFIFCDEKNITIKVSDEGEGINYSSEEKEDDLAPGGRGLKIVRELADDIKIDKNKIVARYDF